MLLKTKNLTPAVYSKESRDFQLIGNVYDTAFALSRAGIGAIPNAALNTHTDKRFATLLCRTLGFFPKRDYSADVLLAVAGIFKDLIKNKGTIKALEKLVLTLDKIHGSSSIKNIVQEKDAHGNTVISLYVSNTIEYIDIIEELLQYIVPVGILVNIYKFQGSAESVSSTNVLLSDSITYETISEDVASCVRDTLPSDSDGNTIVDPLLIEPKFWAGEVVDIAPSTPTTDVENMEE